MEKLKPGVDSVEALAGIEFTHPSIEELQKLRDLRIRAVTEESRAFGTTPEEDLSMPEAEWNERIENGSYTIARQGNELIGMVAVVPQKTAKTRHVAFIYSVYVVPEVRGKGVAGRMLQAAMDDARARFSIRKFNLRVASTQEDARKLYESLGFTTVGVMKGELFVDGEYIDETMMEKHEAL